MFILLLQIQNRLRVVLIYKKIWRRFNNRGRKKDFISVWTKSRLNLVYQFILLVWTKTLVKSADSSVHLSHRLKEGNAMARTALQNCSMWLLRFTCSMCSEGGIQRLGLLYTLSYCLQNGGGWKNRKCGGGQLLYLKKIVQVLKVDVETAVHCPQYKKL